MSKLRSLFAVLPLVLASACGDSNEAPKDASPPQDAAEDAAAPDASCFTSPQSYNELINACTSAQKVYKDSHPPLLNADGTLPTLPN